MRRLGVGDRVAVVILVLGVLAGALAVVLGDPDDAGPSWRITYGDRVPTGLVELQPGPPALGVTIDGAVRRLVRRASDGRLRTVAEGGTVRLLPATPRGGTAVVTPTTSSGDARPVLLFVARDGGVRRVRLSSPGDGRTVLASATVPSGDVVLLTRRCPPADGAGCERPRPLELLTIRPDGTREPVQRVPAPQRSGGSAAALAVDARGALLVVSTDDGTLQVRSRTPDGVLGPAEPLAAVGDGVRLAVRTRADGAAVVAWTTRSVGEGRAEGLSTSAAVRLPGGRVFGAPQLLDPGMRPRRGAERDGVVDGPDVGLDGTGQATVLWTQGPADDGHGLLAATSGPSGRFGPPQTLGRVRGGEAGPPSLTVAPDGSAVVSWQPQADVPLRLARRDAGRARFGDPQSVGALRGPTGVRATFGRDGEPTLTGIDPARQRTFRARPG